MRADGFQYYESTLQLSGSGRRGPGGGGGAGIKHFILHIICCIGLCVHTVYK